MLFIGPKAESEFGRRYFRELLSSFVADLELKVLAGKKEIGSVSPISLSGKPGESLKSEQLIAAAIKIAETERPLAEKTFNTLLRFGYSPARTHLENLLGPS